MKVALKLLTPFSVTGASLLFAIGGMSLPVRAQDSTTGGSFSPTPPTPQVTATGDTGSFSGLPAATTGHEALLLARKALANGDLETARSLIDTARNLPMDNAPTGDTPEQVSAMVARHSELSDLRSGGDSHLYNHGAAMFLLEQANRLIDYGDFATVETLVDQARSFGVQFKPGDLNPDHVLGRLASAGQRVASNVQPPIHKINPEARAATLISQAQLAFDRNRLDEALALVDEAKQLNVPDDAFDASAIVPWELELKIREAIQQRGSLATTDSRSPSTIQQADYYPELDQTRNMPAGNEANIPEATPDLGATDARGKQLYDSGMSALKDNDPEGALEYFRMAWKYRDSLDATTLKDLKSRMSQMEFRAANAGFTRQEEITGVEGGLREEIYQDVMKQRGIAMRMVEQRNPRGALNHMRMTRDKVETSGLDPESKNQFVAIIEREITEMERFIDLNLAEIENDELNGIAMQEVELDRQQRDDVERKLQTLVNDFNTLMDEQRFAEAEVVARQAWELNPNSEAVVTMMERARLVGNQERLDDIAWEKARRNEDFWAEQEKGSIISVDTYNPLVIDTNHWDKIRDRPRNVGGGGYGSDKERLIWSALKNQSVQVQYNQTPLREAIAILAERAGVNMIFDTRALELEGVTVEQPVNHNISQPISVESALNIVLGGTGLVFKVEDEVVKITNRAALQANPVERTFYVGDLVVPVPDYSGNALNMQFISPSNPSEQYLPPSGGGFGQNMSDGATIPVNMMQQMPGNGQFGFGTGSTMWSGAAPQTVSPQYSTWGPKSTGQGGITAADFTELIELIQETIDNPSWDENGGSGTIRAFPATLSLIVTQTQENQDRIQDLLTRLRELNDVQIVVEVRFIRLRDDFFERIGIDFDFQLNDNTGLANQAQIPDNINQVIPSRAIVGRAPIADQFIATGDLDIPFTQNSFGTSTPQFGNFAADSALNFGFAILSDIEVFFLLQAAKGDQRSNVTQAPTVTMFNGQSASVFDGVQRPFVTSITPVVGDFAAAQQPVITILPEGTQLNVRAVVSADRRFVKMTLVPFFSQITEVNTFSFESDRRIRRGTGTDLQDILNIINGTDDSPLGNDELEIVESGTTVQLPTFANTTITTTVSVPDGGTVLLGGIKSMSEGRTERGVPFLSNIPYVNRLFKNVGIGRETNSLMMMVTPRIIIQEEEEQNQVNTSN